MNDEDRPTNGSSSSSPGDDGVHRLIDMLVEEVSLVDRPANRQRFLVVKRESEMSANTTKAKTAAPGAKPPKKPAKPPPKGANGNEPENEETEKAKKKTPPKGPNAEAPEDDATEKAKKIPPKAPPPPARADEKDKDGKTKKAAAPKEDPEEEEEEEEEEETEEGEPAGKPPKKASKDFEGGEQGDGLGDETADDDETPLKVALAALESLTQAVELLSEVPDAAGEQLAAVAQDIRDAADAIATAAGFEVEEEEQEEGAEPASQEGSISGLVASIQELLTRIESLTEALEQTTSARPAAPTVTSTTETQSPPDFAGTLAEVAQSMKSLDSLVRGQASRIDRLEKRAGVPNSKPPGERTTKRETEEESWPLDLNRPRDRASVDKTLSFHDSDDA